MFRLLAFIVCLSLSVSFAFGQIKYGQVLKGEARNKAFYEMCNLDYPSMTIDAAFARRYTGVYFMVIAENKNVYVAYGDRPTGIIYQPRDIRKFRTYPVGSKLVFKEGKVNRSLTKGDLVFVKDEEINVAFKGFQKRARFVNLEKPIEIVEEDNEKLEQLLPQDIFEILRPEGDVVALLFDNEQGHYLEFYNSKFEEDSSVKRLYLQQDSKLDLPKINAMELYDQYRQNGQRMGIAFLGPYHAYFLLNLDTPKIEFGELQDNQVLMGCPQTFCFGASVDGIAEDSKAGMIILQQRYYWELADFNSSFSRPFRMSRLKTQDDVNPNLLPPIDAAMTTDPSPIPLFDGFLYVFKSDRMYYRENDINTPIFYWRPMSEVFNLTDREFWESDIDSAFLWNFEKPPEVTNHIALFKGNSYYVFLVPELKAYERKFKFTLLKKGHLSEFTNYPAHVESVLNFRKVAKLYSFSGNWVFIHDLSLTECQSIPITCTPEKVLFQKLFTACADFDYEKTPYKTMEGLEEALIDRASELQAPQKTDKSWILLMIAAFIVTAIVVTLVGTMVFVSRKIKEKQKMTESSIESIEPQMLSPKKSGFSVTDSLKEIVEERRQHRTGKQTVQSPVVLPKVKETK